MPTERSATNDHYSVFDISSIAAEPRDDFLSNHVDRFLGVWTQRCTDEDLVHACLLQLFELCHAIVDRTMYCEAEHLQSNELHCLTKTFLLESVVNRGEFLMRETSCREALRS